MNAQLEVEGSWGTLVVDSVTGVVDREASRLEPGDADSPGYHDIVRVDLIEFVLHYGRPLFPDESFDILDVGYWHEKGYEPPVMDWRTGQNHFSYDECDRDGVNAETLIFYAQPH